MVSRYDSIRFAELPVPFGICAIPIAAMVLLSIELSIVRDETWYSAPTPCSYFCQLEVFPP